MKCFFGVSIFITEVNAMYLSAATGAAMNYGATSAANMFSTYYFIAHSIISFFQKENSNFDLGTKNIMKL